MRAALLMMLVALAACGRPDATRTQPDEPRIPPSVTTPGVHVSGHVNVGVKRGF